LFLENYPGLCQGLGKIITKKKFNLRCNAMDISINAKVFCVDGECGTTVRVIINPIKKEITHIVVREKGIAGLEQLVPLDEILESTPNEVRLRCTRNEFILLDSFSEYEYIPGDDTFLNFEQHHYYMHPYLQPDFEDDFEYAPHYEKIERIPHGELGIRRGAKVQALDGYIGRVDEFIVSPEDYHISHLVLREGHLWGGKLVTIPVSEIDHVEEDQVFLKLDKEVIEKLPSVPLQQRSR
jgi:sporulation protein YlmC with PRC-barrel domain